MSQHQEEINKIFVSHGILYQPGLAKAFDNLSVGILLSQLLYWYGRGELADGWIWKTVDELEAETSLTYSQQKSAIKVCQSHGFLESKKAGLPAKRHLRLDLDKLKTTLVSISKKKELVHIFNADNMVDFISTITETTHEITPQTTTSTTPLEDNEFAENSFTGAGKNEELGEGFPNDW